MTNDAAPGVSAKQMVRGYVLETVGFESHVLVGDESRARGAVRSQIRPTIPSHLHPYLEEVLNDLVMEGYLDWTVRKGETHFIGGLP